MADQWLVEILLDEKHRLVENNFGVFIQKRSNKVAKHNKGRCWRTLKMYGSLEDAFRAWYRGDFN